MRINIILTIGLFSLFIIGHSYGYLVDKVESPLNSNYKSGDKLTINRTLDFTNSNQFTFPEKDSLKITTDLNNPSWEYHILTHNQNGQSGTKYNSKFLTIDGFVLSYPVKNADLQLSITVSGTVPDSASNPDFTVFKIEEMDSANNVVNNYIEKKALITTQATQAPTVVKTRTTDSSYYSPTSMQKNNGFSQNTANPQEFSWNVQIRNNDNLNTIWPSPTQMLEKQFQYLNSLIFQ